MSRTFTSLFSISEEGRCHIIWFEYYTTFGHSLTLAGSCRAHAAQVQWGFSLAGSELKLGLGEIWTTFSGKFIVKQESSYFNR